MAASGGCGTPTDVADCTCGISVRNVPPQRAYVYGSWPGAIISDADLAELEFRGCEWIGFKFEGGYNRAGKHIPDGLFVIRFSLAMRVRKALRGGDYVICQRDCVTFNSVGRVPTPVSVRVKRQAARSLLE